MLSKKRQKLIIEIIKDAHHNTINEYFDIENDPGPELWHSEKTELFNLLNEWEMKIEDSIIELFKSWKMR